MVGDSPAQLLSNLEPEGLRPFSIERPDIDVDEGPSIIFCNLTAKPVYLVITSFDPNQIRSINEGPENLPLLQIIGNEDITLQTSCRSQGCNRIAKISWGRTSHNTKSKFLSLGEGYRNDTVFEGKRRVINRIILEIELLYS